MVKEISNINAFVYHISRLSKDWNLSNPYFLTLRSLLINQQIKINTKTLRIKQEYHFIAKVIKDELNNSEVKKNTKEILSSIDNYLQQRQQNQGNSVIRYLFNIALMKLLGKDMHYKSLEPHKTKEFLSKFQTDDSNLRNIHKILCLIYGVDYTSEEETINDDIDLCLNILYSRLVLTNESKRDKNRLLDYYLKQQKIENIGISSISSERSKGKLLEMAIILKVATGNGLYLPEIEKEQYLSAFTKTVFRERYLNILKESSSIKVFGLLVHNWLVILSFFALEAIVFSLPNFVESISVGAFTIPTKALLELPIWIVLLFNGFIIALYIFIQQRRLSNKISDEKWR